MHVLIIPSWYTSRHRPINGIFFKEQAEILAKKLNKVGVIAPLYRTARNLDYTFNKSFYGLSGGVHTYTKEIWHLPYLPARNTKLWIKTAKFLLEKYIAEQGIPQVIHIHSVILAGEFAVFVKEKYGIPFIITEHASGFVVDVFKNQVEIYRNIVKESFKNVAVSPSLANVLHKKIGGKWDVIPNIIQDSFINSGRINLHKNKSPTKTFFALGVLVPVKGFDILINAFQKLILDGTDFQLRIGGDGSERSRLENLISKNNLNDKIKLLGNLKREDVIREMQNSTFFVSSSLTETFGVVLIEALAMGVPVVATKCGGPEYIVDPKVGILVDSNNSESLYSGLKKIIENENLYNREEIINYCENQFSETVVSNKIIGIYKEAVNG